MAIVHDEHNYASNGKANAALTTGIIGTSGFGLSLLNGLTGFLNGGMARPAMCSEDHFVNRYEAGQAARIAELETEIAELEQERIKAANEDSELFDELSEEIAELKVTLEAEQKELQKLQFYFAR